MRSEAELLERQGRGRGGEVGRGHCKSFALCAALQGWRNVADGAGDKRAGMKIDRNRLGETTTPREGGALGVR
jgi:hypothetical protein